MLSFVVLCGGVLSRISLFFECWVGEALALCMVAKNVKVDICTH